MPIMAANGQSDARGSAWLLAMTARGCMENPSRGPAHETALNNAYRLLESFRGNMFFAHERKPHGQMLLGSKSLVHRIPSQSHLGEVSLAIKNSITTAFGAIDSEEAINILEDTLRKVAYPEKFGDPEGEKLLRTQAFFKELEASLQANKYDAN